MPDREFIHSTTDVVSTLQFALDSGFQVCLDAPQDEPRPYVLTAAEIAKTERGSFELIRPEWVFGPFQTMAITAGHNRGKYFVQRVNYAVVSVSFHGEHIDDGRRRFGGASVSWYREWLELPAKVMRPTPPEVETWFKRLCKQLSSGLVIEAGVHKFRVCKGIIADPDAARCLPPFDWIPWGPEVLHSRRERKTE